MSLDLTTFTESDANARLTETATTVTITSMPSNEDTYLYYDFGAAYFTSRCSFSGQYKQTTNNSSAQWAIGFSDQLAGYHTTGGSEDSLVFTSTSTTSFYSRQKTGGTQTTAASKSTHAYNTDYYFDCFYLSSIGGQYGALFANVYSDSGKTTWLDNSVLALTKDFSLRYFYAVTSINNAGANPGSGTVANVSVTQSAISAGANLTTFTLSGATLAAYADCVVGTALPSNVTQYVINDGGTGYYSGNYVTKLALNITAMSGTNSAFSVGTVANTANTYALNTASHQHQIRATYLSATTAKLELLETNSSFGTSASSITITFGVPLFLKMWRDTAVGTYGTIYLAAYYDPAYSVQFGSTISLALTENINFRYFYAVQGYGSASANTSTFTVGGITITTPALTATKGAFSWAGKSSPLYSSTQSISSAIGAFSWAGKTVSLAAVLQATKGAFSWSGIPLNLGTGAQISTTKGAFGFSGRTSLLSHSIVTTKGSFSWAGKTSINGATVTSLRSWKITKWDTATSKEIPVTGLTTVKYMLYDPTTLKVFDFSDNTFKASAACVTPQGTMTERVLLSSIGVNLAAGTYDILLATTGLSGLYQEYAESYGTDNYFSNNPVRFQDGVEYLGGLTASENTQLVVSTPAAIAAVPSATLTAATTAPIAANVKKVKDQNISGIGTQANPWGPV